MECPGPDSAAGQLPVAGRLHHGSRRRDRGDRSAVSRGAASGSRAGCSSGRCGGGCRMNRFILPLGIFALLAIVLAIGIKHSPEKGTIPSPLIGKAAPQFTLPVLTDSNRTFSSADLKGRWYVFNVWGTWCFECRAEHDTMLQIKKLAQVPLIVLDWKDEDPQAALQWLAELGNPYEVV